MSDQPARIAIDFSTEIDFLTEPDRICPTCGATMIPAGKHAWLCPNQQDQGNGISAELRAAVLDTASKRVDIAPF